MRARIDEIKELVFEILKKNRKKLNEYREKHTNEFFKNESEDN